MKSLSWFKASSVIIRLYKIKTFILYICVWFFVQTQARLKAVETSLASAVEARDKYQMTNRMLEHSLEEKKSKLEEESTCFRVAEKKSETLQSQLNDSRRERVGLYWLFICVYLVQLFMGKWKLSLINNDIN